MLMTKAELLEGLQTGAGQTLSKKTLNELTDAVFNLIAKAVKKDKRFTYPGFGTWTMKKRKARKGRNPQTGAEITIPATKTVTFKPSPSLKNGL